MAVLPQRPAGVRGWGPSVLGKMGNGETYGGIGPVKPAGCGCRGRRGPNLARNFSANPEWELRWVCDLDTDQVCRIAGPSTGVSEDVAVALADPELRRQASRACCRIGRSGGDGEDVASGEAVNDVNHAVERRARESRLRFCDVQLG